MSKNIKIFKQTINIGGSFLPADFPYFDAGFLNKLIESDFFERITMVYEALTNRKLNSKAFQNLKDSEYPASVVSVDDGINVLELFDGATADYSDYIFDKSDLIGKISSIIAVLFSAYCDLVESEQINFNDKINVAVTQSDANFLLASFIAKKIGLPINVITIACIKPIKDAIKGCYFESFNESEIDDVISEFFEEYDYVLDPITAESFIPLVSYVNNSDDDGVFLMPMLISPYKFTRKILKAITGKNQLDVSKAERMLYNETALEMPVSLIEDSNKKFFKKEQTISILDVLQIIKQCI